MENKKLELINSIIGSVDYLKLFITSGETKFVDDIDLKAKELKQILLEEDTYKNASENMEV